MGNVTAHMGNATARSGNDSVQHTSIVGPRKDNRTANLVLLPTHPIQRTKL